MKPDEKTRARIDEVGQLLAQALGEAVVCIAVYGSAAGDEYEPGISDVNLILVLREVRFLDLRLIGTTLARESRRAGTVRFATPLVVEQQYLESARDVFPIELNDIRQRHRVIAGSDLLSRLEIATERLRLQAEREAREKLLHLRALVIHRPNDESLQRALARATSSFRVLVQNLIPPSSSARPGTANAFEEFGRERGLTLRTLGRLQRLRETKAAWPVEQELDELLAALLVEVERLVASLDADGA